MHNGNNIMNTSTNSIVANYETEYGIATSIDLWLTVIMSTILFSSFSFIVWNDRKQSTNPSKRSILTGFNILFVAMLVCNLLSVTFQYIYNLSTDMTLVVIFNCLSFLFGSIFQFLIVLYTLNRGIPVIKATFPAAEKYLMIILILFGLLLTSQFVFSVLVTTSVYLSILFENFPILLSIIKKQNIAIDVLLGSFDLFVVCIYSIYLYKNRSTHVDMKRLIILSRFGIASFVVLEFWLTFIVLNSYWLNASQKQISRLAYSINLHICDLGPMLYLFLQLVLKWELYREDQRRRVKPDLSAKPASNSKSATTMKDVGAKLH
ncbi:hypothetical protein BCR33DRAFT_524455 [Rhizoclosmatium globosum]|uniref:Uncharacterized protein n=1 Tax=Rhizoclosmatium globosum TaxID=329046 RepID=A0A1Y2AEV6_9FUNG|nr:hypothetical protein BCR33DRAFT_217599 [Rhizoclosmatium globosum]ORY50220.1 hypothetical protein BCR33DRAFT_524455 [Rhizoclosmatium globosum]|eukprot:ORY20964.1 hypothetical protein BCR33DRAFT_217599 [Rhizoclosmatium globosum]